MKRKGFWSRNRVQSILIYRENYCDEVEVQKGGSFRKLDRDEVTTEVVSDLEIKSH